MAKKSPAAPTASLSLEQLIAEKVAAGLPAVDATACAKAQIAHDEALAAAEAPASE